MQHLPVDTHGQHGQLVTCPSLAHQQMHNTSGLKQYRQTCSHWRHGLLVVTYPDAPQPHKPGPATNGIQQGKLKGDVAPVGLGNEPVEGLLLQVVGVLKSSLLWP